MSLQEQKDNLFNGRTLVVGSSGIESTFKLLPGERHEPDTTLTMVEAERTFGGAGLCNALAYSRTRLSPVSLLTVGGVRNGIPDKDFVDMADFLKSSGITPQIQHHEGSTEHTMMIISHYPDDPKRGYRTAQANGSLLREKFIVDENARAQLEDSSLLIASSFKPQVILDLAEVYKSLRGTSNPGTFVWTLNKESSQIIGRNKQIQEAIQAGNVDMMFMSHNEQTAILNHLGAIGPMNKIRTIVVTKGEEGCSVRDRLNGHTLELDVPAFKEPKVVKNDNGAGEAHNINFLATFLALQEYLTDAPNHDLRARVIESAAHIGNLAAFIKIQHEQSLWFPALDFSLVRDRILDGSLSPRQIANIAYESYLDNNDHNE